MTNISEVIGWKFPQQEGMNCKPNENGVLVIVKFPGGIPSQADQNTWTAEYEARDIQEEDYNRRLNVDPLLKALALVCADQFGMTPAQMKAAIKAKL